LSLAADGAQANADGTLSETQKIFPVGKQGAVLLGGTVSIQDPVGRAVREELNTMRITSAWLRDHPDATLDVASKELNAQVAAAGKKFFATRNPGTEAGKEKFALVFAGYVGGQPRVSVTRYFMPVARGKEMKAVTVAGEASPGEIWAVGAVKVQQNLLGPSPSLMLQKFTPEPAIKKFASAKHEDLTAQDFADVFSTLLKATESGEGMKFSGKEAVAPPNKFATITPAGGFAWISR
jgi:hypothetical protein